MITMSQKQRHELSALKKLLENSSLLDKLIPFLIEEKIITKKDVPFLTQQNTASNLYELLNKSLKEETLQMVEYTWQILPVEQCKIVIIGKKDKIECSINF